MSKQFLYAQFKVTPRGTLTRATGTETVVIELPSNYLADWVSAVESKPGTFWKHKEA